MIGACVAQSALDYDDGRLPAPLRQREIEENLWRAIRHGLDGTQIDFAAREVIATRAAIERLVEWTAPAREALAISTSTLPGTNGAQRARAGARAREPRWPRSTASGSPRRADTLSARRERVASSR